MRLRASTLSAYQKGNGMKWTEVNWNERINDGWKHEQNISSNGYKGGLNQRTTAK